MQDVKALIAGARLPETTVRVCLRGDLQAQWEQLERELSTAKAKPAGSLAGTGERGIAEQMEALREQMDAATVEFRLRALARRQYQDLCGEHPPRKTDDGGIHPDDEVLGVNTSTFFEALVPVCTVSPDLDAGDWATLLGQGLTDRQFDDLAAAALRMNRRTVDVPFSLAASRILASEPE